MPEEPRVVAPTKALLERADAREAALRALVDAESSAQRREHIAALQREFEQLSNLPSHKAFGWAQRRENHSAARLQSAWRRRSATRAFKRTVRAALASRREQAAAAIQRAQRTKHRTVFETAPPVSQEMVAEMSRAVMTLTLERAHELKEARKAIAKAKEADPGATRPERSSARERRTRRKTRGADAKRAAARRNHARPPNIMSSHILCDSWSKPS